MTKQRIQTGIEVPKSKILLSPGLFAAAFARNVNFLKSLSMDSILYWFRQKAGKHAPGEPFRGHFEDNIKGQTAGLFLMGAANSLRWIEDVDLQQKVQEVVDCIDACKEPDGFLEPIPKAEFGTKEYPNYVRVWLNYGLTAAALVGNTKALILLRGMQDWFNACDERRIVKYLMLAYQGVIANTTVYFSDVGIADDLDAVTNWYQEDWWLGQFLRRDQTAIYGRPTPHGTELEAITAYMDMYLATGKAYYLNAVDNAYKMFKASWQHVGGGIVAIEHTDISPGCLWLDPVHKYNELCCSAHWLYLNQRYHRLHPEDESFVGEIERTLYNVVIANQVGSEYIRYHAFIDVQKDFDIHSKVSCCAGLGTRILGSLPEFLYSIAPDGLFVDIYSNSSITWTQDSTECGLSTTTELPFGGHTVLRLRLSNTASIALRLRIPAWAESPVRITINGGESIASEAGSYCTLRRAWQDGDVVTLELMPRMQVTEYSGIDKVQRNRRFSFEYGPLLLGLTGPFNTLGRYILVKKDPFKPSSWLIPVPEQPLHFRVADMPGYEYLPYYEINNETFSCFPLFAPRRENDSP